VKVRAAFIEEAGTMRFVTRTHLSRRTLLKGVGTTLALPLLDSMIPALTAQSKTAAAPLQRLGFVYILMVP
jgi:hypothetical protein